MEDQDYILFDQYILEELSSEERIAFEERLTSDSEFKKSFESYKELSSFLENKFKNEDETVAFKNNLKQISDAHFSKTETVSEAPKNPKVFRFRQLAIAASVAILLGVFVFNQFKNPTYNDFANYDSISLTVRGVQDDLLTEAENAFNTKNYSEVELLFNQILKEDPLNLEVELYKSIALIETAQFSEADEVLSGLSETNSVFKNKAKWYWALSKLKQEDFESCLTILKTIPEEADDYKQAQKLLNKLD
jgi:anti-sigma-K factor RskA